MSTYPHYPRKPQVPEPEAPLLNCDTCCREIPATSDVRTEVDDLVMHFCGLECYAQWKKNRPTDAEV